MMYDDRGWGWGWWMMGGGLLLLLLVLVGAVVAIVLATRRTEEPRGPVAPGSQTPAEQGYRHPSDDALRELDLRLARGEVDEDAYRRTRELLIHHRTG
jgi:uncharacterized membrane protein